MAVSTQKSLGQVAALSRQRRRGAGAGWPRGLPCSAPCSYPALSIGWQQRQAPGAGTPWGSLPAAPRAAKERLSILSTYRTPCEWEEGEKGWAEIGSLPAGRRQVPRRQSLHGENNMRCCRRTMQHDEVHAAPRTGDSRQQVTACSARQLARGMQASAAASTADAAQTQHSRGQPQGGQRPPAPTAR